VIFYPTISKERMDGMDKLRLSVHCDQQRYESSGGVARPLSPPASFSSFPSPGLGTGKDVGRGFSLAFRIGDKEQTHVCSCKIQRFCMICGKPKGSPYVINKFHLVPKPLGNEKIVAQASSLHLCDQRKPARV